MASINHYPARTQEQKFSCTEIATVYRRDMTYIIVPANTPFLYRKNDSSGYYGYIISDVDCRCFIDHYMENTYTFTAVTDNPGDAEHGYNHITLKQGFHILPPEEATDSWQPYIRSVDGKWYGRKSTGGTSLENYAHLVAPILGDGTRELTFAEAVDYTYGSSAVPPIGN